MRDVLREMFFIVGFFALLFTAMTSSSFGEELGLYVKAHPIPLIEAQPTLGLD